MLTLHAGRTSFSAALRDSPHSSIAAEPFMRKIECKHPHYSQLILLYFLDNSTDFWTLDRYKSNCVLAKARGLLLAHCTSALGGHVHCEGQGRWRLLADILDDNPAAVSHEETKQQSEMKHAGRQGRRQSGGILRESK